MQTPTVTRITADHAHTNAPIYANRDETKIVSETDPECDHLVTWSGKLFPFSKAVKLGLLDANAPINTEAAIQHTAKPEGKKVVDAPDETKRVDVGSTKKSDIKIKD
jgi:hypothetical protein